LKATLVVLAVILLPIGAAAGVPQDQFQTVMELIGSDNFDSARVLIGQIETTYPDDPEYYVLSINYYYAKSRKDYVEIVPGPPTGDDTTVVFRDSTGEIAGFFRSHVQLQMDTLMTGIRILQQGVAIHPDRLDMRFGIVHVAEAAQLYQDMSDALIGILKRSQENGNEWLWSFSEPLAEDPEQFVLDNVQSRVHMLFQQDTDEADSLLTAISLAMIQAYPGCTYGHTNLGIVASLHGDYDSCFYHLSEALRIDSTDMIVMANLADVYEKTGLKEKAVECYNLMISKGSAEEQAFARQQLLRLGE